MSIQSSQGFSTQSPAPHLYRRPVYSPPAPDSIPTLPTEDYLTVVREADTRSFDNRGPADGEVHMEELYDYRQQNVQALQIIQLFELLLGPVIGKLLDPFKRQFQNRLQVIDIMGDNYRRFSNPQNLTNIREPGITEGTVQTIAKTDGTPGTISHADIYDMPNIDPLKQKNPITGKEGSLEEYLNSLFPGTDLLAQQTRDAASNLLNGEYESDSPQHHELQKKFLELTEKDPSRFSDSAVQHVFIKSSRNSLRKTIGSLNKIGANLEEESPQYQALQARIASLKAIDKALELQETRVSNLLKIKPDVQENSQSHDLLKNISDTSKASFQKDVLDASKQQPVIVQFWASWCPPCKALSPILDEVAGDFKDKIKVVRINLDENPDLAEQYQVNAIPTLLVIKDGNVVDRTKGLQSKAALTETFNKQLNPVR